ncbi:acyl-CoA dehydrogenase family protein [Gordonia humi]|uniref:Alkylation response protein AidB-like acyl-CoA dehydrogenase n=1 Tax=Gordonia humi TaxID=686429 RepID=A0A840EXL9_9ACTN|nr:acyl-CoA dehydrogenase [Gordonia humi]MBB4135088.1 alkylation response protein AidB-like acyl-CoA dehydrogenase [Gordonia humi]
MTVSTRAPLTRPADAASTAGAEAAEIAPKLAGADFRSAWRTLLALPSVSAVMADSLRGEVGDGAVVNAVGVIEGLGRAGVPNGLVYALTSQIFGVQWPLSASARSPLEPYRDGLLDGSIVLCHALTEETGGSDPLSMRTAATPTDDGYRIDGRKAYVTAAPEADLILTFARTDAARHPFALSSFLLPADRPGIARSEPFAKVALPEVPMGAIDFTDVAASDADLVAAEGSGLAFLTSTTTWERALLMGYAVGGMGATIDRAVDWLRDREQFGRSLGANPLVASHVADLATIRHRVRTLVYDMARRIDAGTAISALATDAAQVKISCAQDLLAFESAAAPLFGARSVIADSPHAGQLTTAVAASIYAGSNDLLRVSIARDLGLPVEN